MKVLIDTNVVLDMALQRQPFADASTKVLFFAQTQRFRGYVSASVISDIYYILRKSLGHAASLDFLRHLVVLCEVAAVKQTVIETALVSDFQDFEDSIQNCIAVESGLDAIVTRNAKDFAKSSLEILTPEQLIQILE